MTDLNGLVGRLTAHGVLNVRATQPLGLEADRFEGTNYISAFWGTHTRELGSTPERALLAEEVELINRRLSAAARR